jgi:NNP family nitrate/nitrite transporter-like MFS transporter
METTTVSTRPFPLFPLVFLAALFYLNFVGRVVLAPLLPVIEAELDLGHGAAGSLFFFQAAGQTVGLLLSGIISWRLTHRGALILSAVAVGAVLLAISQTPGLGLIRSCLVLLGLAAGLYLPSAIATITGLAAQSQWGRAMAIHELAPGLGFVTAPLLAEALLQWLSWRSVLGVFGTAILAVGLLYARWGRGGRHRGEPPRIRTMLALSRNGGLLRIAALFTLAVGAGFGVYMMLPLLLVAERGMDRGSANALIGLSRILTLPMIVAAGWIADRVGQRRALVMFQATTGLLTMCLALTTTPLATTATAVLQAAASVCFFPPCYPMIAHSVSPAERNLGVSLVSICGTVLGAGLTPPLMGYIAEASSFTVSLLLIGFLTLASPMLLWLEPRAPISDRD